MTTVPALQHVSRLAQRAGRAILTCSAVAPEIKADGSPVTQADRVAQDVICAELAAWDASIPIVAEESCLPDPVLRASWRRYWLVDPLDGTKEFLAGRSDYTVNIALIEDGEPVMGVVYAPALNVLYSAGRGLGSWRQEGDQPAVRLQVQPPVAGAGLRIVVSRSHPSPELERFLRDLPVVAKMPLGSSLKFCWLAEGRADCYPRFGPTMAWDVAAGDCVFRNASVGSAPNPSTITYNPADFRQGPFIAGFVP